MREHNLYADISWKDVAGLDKYAATTAKSSFRMETFKNSETRHLPTNSLSYSSLRPHLCSSNPKLPPSFKGCEATAATSRSPKRGNDDGKRKVVGGDSRNSPIWSFLSPSPKDLSTNQLMSTNDMRMLGTIRSRNFNYSHTWETKTDTDPLKMAAAIQQPCNASPLNGGLQTNLSNANNKQQMPPLPKPPTQYPLGSTILRRLTPPSPSISDSFPHRNKHIRQQFSSPLFAQENSPRKPALSHNPPAVGKVLPYSSLVPKDNTCEERDRQTLGVYQPEHGHGTINSRAACLRNPTYPLTTTIPPPASTKPMTRFRGLTEKVESGEQQHSEMLEKLARQHHNQEIPKATGTLQNIALDLRDLQKSSSSWTTTKARSRSPLKRSAIDVSASTATTRRRKAANPFLYFQTLAESENEELYADVSRELAVLSAPSHSSVIHREQTSPPSSSRWPIHYESTYTKPTTPQTTHLTTTNGLCLSTKQQGSLFDSSPAMTKTFPGLNLANHPLIDTFFKNEIKPPPKDKTTQMLRFSIPSRRQNQLSSADHFTETSSPFPLATSCARRFPIYHSDDMKNASSLLTSSSSSTEMPSTRTSTFCVESNDSFETNFLNESFHALEATNNNAVSRTAEIDSVGFFKPRRHWGAQDSVSRYGEKECPEGRMCHDKVRESDFVYQSGEVSDFNSAGDKRDKMSRSSEIKEMERELEKCKKELCLKTSETNEMRKHLLRESMFSCKREKEMQRQSEAFSDKVSFVEKLENTQETLLAALKGTERQEANLQEEEQELSIELDYVKCSERNLEKCSGDVQRQLNKSTETIEFLQNMIKQIKNENEHLERQRDFARRQAEQERASRMRLEDHYLISYVLEKSEPNGLNNEISSSSTSPFSSLQKACCQIIENYRQKLRATEERNSKLQKDLDVILNSKNEDDVDGRQEEESRRRMGIAENKERGEEERVENNASGVKDSKMERRPKNNTEGTTDKSATKRKFEGIGEEKRGVLSASPIASEDSPLRLKEMLKEYEHHLSTVVTQNEFLEEKAELLGLQNEQLRMDLLDVLVHTASLEDQNKSLLQSQSSSSPFHKHESHHHGTPPNTKAFSADGETLLHQNGLHHGHEFNDDTYADEKDEKKEGHDGRKTRSPSCFSNSIKAAEERRVNSSQISSPATDALLPRVQEAFDVSPLLSPLPLPFSPSVMGEEKELQKSSNLKTPAAPKIQKRPTITGDVEDATERSARPPLDRRFMSCSFPNQCLHSTATADGSPETNQTTLRPFSIESSSKPRSCQPLPEDISEDGRQRKNSLTRREGDDIIPIAISKTNSLVQRAITRTFPTRNNNLSAYTTESPPPSDINSTMTSLHSPISETQLSPSPPSPPSRCSHTSATPPVVPRQPQILRESRKVNYSYPTVTPSQSLTRSFLQHPSSPSPTVSPSSSTKRTKPRKSSRSSPMKTINDPNDHHSNNNDNRHHSSSSKHQIGSDNHFNHNDTTNNGTSKPKQNSRNGNSGGGGRSSLREGQVKGTRGASLTVDKSKETPPQKFSNPSNGGGFQWKPPLANLKTK